MSGSVVGLMRSLQDHNPDAIAWLATACLGGSRGYTFGPDHPAPRLFHEFGFTYHIPADGHVVIKEAVRLVVLENVEPGLNSRVRVKNWAR